MKTIGIPTALYGDTFGINAKYIEFASEFGIPKLLVPHDNNRGVDKEVDILLLPGGSDSDKELSYLNGRSNPHLGWFDKYCLPYYIENNIPIFAICRGLQVINQYMGGTLKNLPYGHNYNRNEEEKCKLVHNITISSSIGTYETTINSIHHQAINKVGDDILVTSRSYPFDSIESIEFNTRPIIGVQWHPEKIYDNFSVDAMNYLKSLESKNKNK